MRIALLLCLFAAPAVADELSTQERLELACKGWSVDRLLISILDTKRDEMTEALERIDSESPSSHLAKAMTESLGTISYYSGTSQEESAPVWTRICAEIQEGS